MPKFVAAMRLHSMYAGEVIEETPKNYLVAPISDCPYSVVSQKFQKKDVVFTTDSKERIVRLMSLYSIVTRQHKTIIDAAEKSYGEILASITSRIA